MKVLEKRTFVRARNRTKVLRRSAISLISYRRTDIYKLKKSEEAKH